MDRLSTTLGMVHTTLDLAAVFFNTTQCQCVPGYSWKTVAMLYKDMDGSPEAILALNYDTLGFMMEAELHLMDMVDRDKVSVVEGLRVKLWPRETLRQLFVLLCE